DRRPDILFGNAISFDDFALAVCRTASVAAHRRNDDRLTPESANVISDRLNDQGDVGDTTAASRDRHSLSGLNPSFKPQSRKLTLHRSRDVDELCGVKLLSNPNHSWKGHDYSAKSNLPQGLRFA